MVDGANEMDKANMNLRENRTWYEKINMVQFLNIVDEKNEHGNSVDELMNFLLMEFGCYSLYLLFVGTE